MRKKSYDRSDKELDDILKKISDSAEIPFSEEDWGDMQARLDQTPTTTWLVNKGLGWAGAILMSIVMSMLIWNSQSENQDAYQNTIAYETQHKMSRLNSGESEFSEKTQAMENSTQTEISPIKSNDSDLWPSSSAKISSANSQIQSSEGTENTRAGKEEKIRAMDSKSSLPIISDFKNMQNSPLIWQVNHVPSLNLRVSLLQKIDFQAREAKETNPNHEEIKKERENQFAGKFNLSIQAAPDLSGIKLNQVGKVGQAIGIGAEYFLRPRFSIASGVFYSFKPYSSEDGYQLGYGNQPDRVIGECDILDIPFNLRFYPIEGKLQRVFASAGLSTYLMLKEHYKMEYQNTGTGYPYSHELDVNGANNHFFGVVNFSVGYERKLGNKISVQVEPYFKVPINGVGEGDISLKSTGLFVGLKFYPNHPKR
ncbi:hypothetical protein SYJ56_00340 [Algoriphagus sp. D3-2-R+10]|uniref:hypothetical protein n=1 Tax=Algoriphagus aurantiacus TaxID=3103948 RepID=UPI002B3A38E2|nr:hypothetical protein [Algoriphagus sp. D3-2-R+10]MEB2773731.1 hypothetical protein [Algoriphagus sp. D3-2-R+10]